MTHAAELRNFVMVGDRGHGNIHNDTKGRFRDGEVVTTSTVLRREGDLVHTKNTVYKVVDYVHVLAPQEFQDALRAAIDIYVATCGTAFAVLTKTLDSSLDIDGKIDPLLVPTYEAIVAREIKRMELEMDKAVGSK